MKFGDRFVKWVETQSSIQKFWNEIAESPVKFWGNVKEAMRNVAQFQLQTHHPILQSLGYALLVIIGEAPDLKTVIGQWPDWLNLTDPSTTIGEFMREAVTSEQYRETLETIGSLVWDTVLGTIVYGGEATPQAAREASRRLIGTVTTLTGTPQILSAIAEIASVGQIDKLGDMVQSIYWNLGLGFLTWQTMGDAFGAYISEPLSREYDYLTRPRRLSASQITDAFMVGEITKTQAAHRLAELGLPDDDLNLALRLAFRSLGRADITSFMVKGLISESEAMDRLMRLGYTLADSRLILQEIAFDLEQEYRDTPKATLKSAYKEGLLSQAELRTGLADLGYSPETIDLEVTLLQMDLEEEYRALGVTQVKEAYLKGVVGRAEAISLLVDLGYAQEGIDTLLKTWDLIGTPLEQRLTRSTITKAYTLGVVDYGSAMRNLQDLGYSYNNSKVLLEVADREATDIERKPTISALTQAYQIGLLNLLEFRAKIADLGYSGEDVDLYVALADYQEAKGTKGLSKTDILAALKKGYMGPGEALIRLIDLGYNQDDAIVLVLMNEPVEEEV